MIRVEIIANNSVEENILEALKDTGVGKYYTKYPGIRGVGSSGPRMGDPIWPEENFVLVFWCEEEEAMGIERAVTSVKAQFPNEGVKIFGIPEKVKPVQKPIIEKPAEKPVIEKAEKEKPKKEKPVKEKAVKEKPAQRRSVKKPASDTET